MCEMLVTSWDDYTSQELSLDLKSLTVKGARLCVLADMDWAQQQCDITFWRRNINRDLLQTFSSFVKEQFAPLLLSTLADMNSLIAADKGKRHEQLPSPMQLFGILQDGISEEDVENVAEKFASFVKVIEQAANNEPEEAYYPDVSPIQKLWQMITIFTHQLYMVFHFQRSLALCEKEIPSDEAGINLQRCIHWYEKTAEGSEELKRYKEALEFDKGRMLTLDELQAERKELRKIVPEVFQRCFMQHINNMEEFGKAWLPIDATKEENLLLVDALAKWQLLTREMEKLLHPEQIVPELYNNVFNTMLHEQRIDLLRLRKQIESMLKYVDKKNKWICVWSVLNFHNLLKDTSPAAFANQMMHADWFGGTSYPQFTDDTINEYSGYFTDTLYPHWNDDDYRKKKKSRWSPTLCRKFKSLCIQMDAAFRYAY